MAPKFGTSGLRGLVTELTPELVADHIRAFLRACPVGTGLWVARDLRPSSPDIAAVVIETALSEGVDVTDCGPIPTPALALASMGAGAAAVMVTGSHIPADRNGLKFYLPSGEILKNDEAAITAALGQPGHDGARGTLRGNTAAGAAWVQRYVTAFGADALAGRRIGVWTHSAVSRDLLLDAMGRLGADVVELGRSDTFIPVDTEAVPDWARESIRGWVTEHHLDALVSTDGDGDRPLLADETGAVVPGDILGQITARAVGAKIVVTPVTSNTGVELGGHFARVIRTKVGSPYVIAGMEAAGGKVAGYEANGGFLLGFDAQAAGPLPALMTRDSLLPLVGVLGLGERETLSQLIAQEPARHTATGLIRDLPENLSAALVRSLIDSTTHRTELLDALGESAATIDLTDGLRITCTSGRVLHLRPSGNAPELRVYVQSDRPDISTQMVAKALETVKLHAALRG